MKLRFYLRGLGIGMIVTALLMGFATGKSNTITDDEVIQRAKELGMVSGNKTLVIEETKTPEAEPTPVVTKEPEVTVQPTSEPTEEPTPEPTPEITPRPEVTLSPQAEALEPKILQINGGESSVSVSKSLYELGLVTSSGDFDSYLCNNGYDKIISVGTYEIPVDASYEDIAKIITRR